MRSQLRGLRNSVTLSGHTITGAANAAPVYFSLKTPVTLFLGPSIQRFVRLVELMLQIFILRMNQRLHNNFRSLGSV